MDDATFQRALVERDLLISGLEHPGFQLLMVKLNKAATDALADYDACNFFNAEGIEKAQTAQAFRRIIITEIPRVCEALINIEKPEKPWSFLTWLAGILGRP